LQGALYVVLGENKRSLVTKRNWDVITQLWPALVQAQLHCEKPSMLRLFDEVIDKLHTDIETTELSLVVSMQLKVLHLARRFAFEKYQIVCQLLG
jgi:hypothetical protein